MRVVLLAALLLSTSASAQAVCTETAQRVPTVRVGGDSLVLNVCVVGGAGPITKLDTDLPGGLTGGWLVKNAGVSGQTAATIAATYTADEATLCNGERCAHLILEGGVNSLRTGVTPAATLASMVAVVDDALAKGYAVVWLDVTPYAGSGSAGTNPIGQANDYNALWTAACAARASNPRLMCLANYSTFVDPGNPGYLLAAYSCDGVHYSQVGMDLISTRIRTALLSIP